MPKLTIIIKEPDATEWLNAARPGLVNVGRRQRRCQPPGCETPSNFGRIAELSSGTIYKYLAEGMPNIDGYPILNEALAWLSDRGNKRGLKGVVRFAKMVGCDWSVVRRWVKKGLPLKDGGIDFDAALRWVNNTGELNRTARYSAPKLANGYENRRKFAIRIGVSRSAVDAWLEKGIPASPNGWIHISGGLDWVHRNHHPRTTPPKDAANPSEFEPRSAFAKRHGVGVGLVHAWANKGMPCANNGWVNIDKGGVWVKQHRRILRQPGYENFTAFSKRLGYDDSRGVVARMARHGLPVRGALVEIDAGLKWVAENWHPSEAPPRDVPDPENYVSGTEFAKIIGVAQTLVSKYLIPRGLPHARNKWIHKERGITWWNEYRVTSKNQSPGAGYETKVAFCARVGVEKGTAIAWAKRGLPTAPNGWPNIYRGLCWVRDNTKIEIPASAWDGVVPDDAPQTSKMAAD